MIVEYVHASKYGNGETVAEEFSRLMAERGAKVHVHHVKDVRAKDLPPADLYLFSAPGRFGKPIGAMRRFLRKVAAPAGARCAILTTEGLPQTDGTGPGAEEYAKRQKVTPVMRELVRGAGMVEVAAATVHVLGIKGPLEDGWERTVAALVDELAAA